MFRLTKGARLVTAVAVGFAALGLSACSGDDTLKVCTTLPYEPFQYEDKDKNNEVVGFDVDMIDMVAEKMGKKQEIVDTGFPPIKSGEAMANGTCQIGAAAITITPEREKVMDFSDPYYDSFQSLAVLKDSKHKSLEELKGKTIGVQNDTTGEEYAEKHQKEFGYEIKAFKNLADQRESLLNGSIAGAVNDVPVWGALIQKDPDSIVIAEKYDTGEQYGYAVAKGDTETLKVINEVIKESKENKKYHKIYKKWIGEEYTGD